MTGLELSILLPYSHNCEIMSVCDHTKHILKIF